jgi:hypothetical protein
MKLAVAAGLSAAGNAAKEGLINVQKYDFMKELEAQRQEMENLRQERNLSAQRGMHTETITAHATEGKLTREQAERIALAHDSVLKEVEASREKSAEKIAKEGHDTQKEIAVDHDRTQEKIASAHDSVTKLIADQQDATKNREIKLVSETATRSTLAKELKELREDNSMIAVKMATLASDPIKGTDNPEYKALNAQYKKNLLLVEGYSTRLAKEFGMEIKNTEPQGRAPFKNPFPSSGGTVKRSTPAPGSTAMTPYATNQGERGAFGGPPLDEQGLMQRELDALK